MAMGNALETWEGNQAHGRPPTRKSTEETHGPPVHDTCTDDARECARSRDCRATTYMAVIAARIGKEEEEEEE